MAADYPEGPYGKEVGDTFPRMTFLDRHGGVVDLADDYQGSLRARIVFATAMWCQPCVGDAEALHAEMLENHPESGSLGVLFEDNHGGEVSAQEAGAYNDGVDAFEFVADPGLAIHAVFEVAASLPRVVVLDTETMQIAYIDTGHDMVSVVEAVIAIEDS